MDLLGPVPSCAGALVRSGTGVVEENNARVDRERKKKGQKGGVGASFAPLEIARGAVSTPRFYVSKRINDHPAVNHTSLEKAP